MGNLLGSPHEKDYSPPVCENSQVVCRGLGFRVQGGKISFELQVLSVGGRFRAEDVGFQPKP